MSSDGFVRFRNDGGLYLRCEGMDEPHVFTTRLSAPPRDVLSPAKQLHSQIVRVVTSHDVASPPECDGLVTTQPGLRIAVRTADCVPLLLSAPGVVAAVHSGWRGTAADIAGEAVRVMRTLGAHPSAIRAAIGPCIHSCCYTVREDMRGAVASALGEELCDRFITPAGGEDPLWRADLPGIVRAELIRAGLDKESIFVSSECTACDTGTFFSYRAEGGLHGSLYAVISLSAL